MNQLDDIELKPPVYFMVWIHKQKPETLDEWIFNPPYPIIIRRSTTTYDRLHLIFKVDGDGVLVAATTHIPQDNIEDHIQSCIQIQSKNYREHRGWN